jgi:hypothetical protein
MISTILDSSSLEFFLENRYDDAICILLVNNYEVNK